MKELEFAVAKSVLGHSWCYHDARHGMLPGAYSANLESHLNTN